VSADAAGPPTRARLARELIPLLAAIALVGGSFGAVAAATGLSAAKTLALSALVYAGGAQFLVVAAAASGAGGLTLLAGGLLLNARHLTYGLVLAEVMRGPWWRRLIGAHLMTDEATALTLAQPDPAAARRAFGVAGVLLFLTWNAATVLGMVAGEALGDPAAFGVDAAFPAALLALVIPTIVGRSAARVAVAAAVLAVLATPLLPAGVGILVGLTAMVLAGRGPQ